MCGVVRMLESLLASAQALVQETSQFQSSKSVWMTSCVQQLVTARPSLLAVICSALYRQGHAGCLMCMQPIHASASCCGSTAQVWAEQCQQRHVCRGFENAFGLMLTQVGLQLDFSLTSVGLKLDLSWTHVGTVTHLECNPVNPTKSLALTRQSAPSSTRWWLLCIHNVAATSSMHTPG